jgi:putative transposase
VEQTTQTIIQEQRKITMVEFQKAEESCERVFMRLLALLCHAQSLASRGLPRQDGDLSRFMNWLTLTHTQRWHQHRHSVREGHVYQGRFKSFPVETSEYLLTICRYVEGNPVRAGLVERAEQWRWSSAGAHGSVPVHDWPMERPSEWLDWVNEGETNEQLSAVRRSVIKGPPYGSEPWVERMVMQWNLGATSRERGRTKKELVNNGS